MSKIIEFVGSPGAGKTTILDQIHLPYLFTREKLINKYHRTFSILRLVYFYQFILITRSIFDLRKLGKLNTLAAACAFLSLGKNEKLIVLDQGIIQMLISLELFCNQSRLDSLKILKNLHECDLLPEKIIHVKVPININLERILNRPRKNHPTNSMNQAELFKFLKKSDLCTIEICRILQTEFQKKILVVDSSSCSQVNSAINEITKNL